MEGVEKILDIITGILCLLIAAIQFIIVVLNSINGVIASLFLCCGALLLALAPYKEHSAFGFAYNPIGRPLFLVIISAFNFPVFNNGFCSEFSSCMLNVVSLTGFIYGWVLLVIYIVLMATGKVSYDRT